MLSAERYCSGLEPEPKEEQKKQKKERKVCKPVKLRTGKIAVRQSVSGARAGHGVGVRASVV